MPIKNRELDFGLSPKNAIVLWIFLCTFYAVLIGIMSYWFPYGVDEITRFNSPSDVFTQFIYAYQNYNPRIWPLFNNIILYLGKWSFVLANPTVQLTLVLGIFYFISGRMPDFKKTDDVPSFLFICLLILFTVPQPDNTLIWIGGATNYSWPACAYVLFLCLLRALADGKIILKNSSFILGAMFFAGIILGMGNENSSPMMLLIAVGFELYCYFKKIKTPPWFYALLAGTAVGVLLLFASPSSYKRLSLVIFDEFKHAPITERAWWHIERLITFVNITMWLPVVTFLMILTAGFNGAKKPLKNKTYLLAFTIFWCATAMAAALFLAPLFNETRTFFSAAVFFIIAFLLMLRYIKEAYSFDFIKYAVWPLVTIAVFFSAELLFPYFDLHEQEIRRLEAIAQAKAEGRQEVFLPGYRTTITPFRNLTVLVFDGLWDNARSQEYYGIKITDDIDHEGQRRLLKDATIKKLKRENPLASAITLTSK